MLDAFLTLLDGGRPKRIVWTADITYWIAGEQQAGRADPAWDTEEGYLRLHRDLGILPYYYYEKFWAAEPRYDGRIESVDAKEGDKTVRRFRTPVGELREEIVYSPTSCSRGITKHFVESKDDLDVLLYLLSHRRLVPANLADWPARRRMWAAHGGLPSIGLPRSPLAAFLVEWAGIQNATYLLLDHPADVAEVLRLMEEQETPVMEAVCELSPPLVHFPDNLTSECTTGLYDDYMAAGHRRRLERLHAAGVKCAVHLDGTVKGLLPKLVRSGFDAVEALTPKPAGDLSLEAMRDLAGSRSVILWGGVPGAIFAPPYRWPQVKAHVEQLLIAWKDQPFVVGVADQVPPDGDMEFCRRIADLVGTH